MILATLLLIRIATATGLMGWVDRLAPLQKAFREVLLLHCKFERLKVLFTQPRLSTLG